MTYGLIRAFLRAEVPFGLVIWTKADREQQVRCSRLISYFTSPNMVSAARKVSFYLFTDDFTLVLLVKWIGN